MADFVVPTRDQVSDNNKAIFDNLQKGLGFVPNIYAALAHSDSALGDFLTFQNRKSSLSTKEKEVINLVVSEINSCSYCLSAHTAIGKMNGFNDDQILEIRGGSASFDSKLNALAVYARETAVTRGRPSVAAKEALSAAGYTEESIVDILLVVGEITVTNLFHGVTQVPVDFPLAQSLELATV